MQQEAIDVEHHELNVDPNEPASAALSLSGQSVPVTQSRRLPGVQLIGAVREVLRRHDPEGLLEMGAPDDEYDEEAARLAGLVSGHVQPMEATVEEIWRGAFGDHHNLRDDKLRGVTDDLRALHYGRSPRA